MSASSSTARLLIEGAIRLIKGASYRVSNSELGIGLIALNDMILSWSADQINVPVIISGSFALSAGTSSYTIGSGGDISTVRPTEIKKGVYIRDTDSMDHPIRLITREQYKAISNKTLSARPTSLYYEPSYPLGTIYFDRSPADIETVYYDSLKPLTAITAANIDTALALPPEYQLALKFNLAIVLAPEYADIKIPEFVVETAKKSKEAIKRVNRLSAEEVSFDYTLSGGYGMSRSDFESGDI